MFLPSFKFNLKKGDKQTKSPCFKHDSSRRIMSQQRKQPINQLALDLECFSNYCQNFDDRPKAIQGFKRNSFNELNEDNHKVKTSSCYNRLHSQMPNQNFYSRRLCPTLSIRKKNNKNKKDVEQTPKISERSGKQFQKFTFFTAKKLKNVQTSRPQTQKVIRLINPINLSKNNPSLQPIDLSPALFRPWSPQKVTDNLFDQQGGL